MDKEEMNSIFREIAANNFNYNSVDYFEDYLSILYEYMISNYSMYSKEANEELKDYLCGKWECGYYDSYKNKTISRSFYVTYNEDGSAKYSNQNSWRWDWDLNSDGQLQSFFGNSYVCILSDNVFFFAEVLFLYAQKTIYG